MGPVGDFLEYNKVLVHCSKVAQYLDFLHICLYKDMMVLLCMG